MKEGRRLDVLMAEIERMTNAKKDYIASSDQMEMEYSEGLAIPLQLNVNGAGIFELRKLAHEQIADRVGIPRKYYDRMLTEEPELLTYNVNKWFNKNPERRMVRTIDSHVRAYLSDRYRPYDNDIVALSALAAFRDIKELQVISAEITETRFYIQAVTPSITDMVKVGDRVQAGITISNSEVGLGAAKVEPLLYFLRCLNGMITGHSLRKYHIGKRTNGNDGENGVAFEADTIHADNRAFALMVRDTVKQAFNVDVFQENIRKLRKASGEVIEGDIVKAVENVSNRFTLSEDEKKELTNELIRGADFTKYGMANAMTAIANTHESYDRAVELQRYGGTIIELSPKDIQDV